MDTDTCARLRRHAARLTAVATVTGAALATAATAQAAPALTANASHDVLLGQRVTVRGDDGSGHGGQRLAIEARHGGGWSVVAHATTRADGSYRASWRPGRLGRYSLRTVAVGPTAIVAASASATKTITVYRAVEASYYGPGLYGGALACGGTLEPGELGVANKTLPCGSRVTLRYHGRSVTVRVIDRGPYVAGREYDLTEATRSRLGFPDTGTLWSSR